MTLSHSIHAWYDQNAEAYAAQTAELLPIEALERFASEVTDPARALAAVRVLDAGCGSGRDAAWLQSRGFVVDAIDASAALCERARQRFGVDARPLSMLDLDAVGAYDGVWASASLVHMVRDDAVRALYNLARSVRPGGVLYLSVKEGDGEGLDRLGRFFRYWHLDDVLAALAEAAPGAAVLRTWSNRPTLDTAGAGFINVLARLDQTVRNPSGVVRRSVAGAAGDH